MTSKSTQAAADREGASDECIARAIMVKGSALARAQIAKAQQTAGRATQTGGA